MNVRMNAAAALDGELRAAVRRYTKDAWRDEITAFVREHYPDENAALFAAEAGIGALHHLLSIAWEHQIDVVQALSATLAGTLRDAFEGPEVELLPWQLLFGDWLRMPGEIFEHAETEFDGLQRSLSVDDLADDVDASDSKNRDVGRGVTKDVLATNSGEGPSDARSKSHGRKSHGSFYTPAVIVETTLDGVFYAPGDQDKTLLDPAMGCGFFLIAGLRRLLAARLVARAEFPIERLASRRTGESPRDKHASGSQLDEWTDFGGQALRELISGSLRFAELDARCVAIFQSTLELAQKAMGVARGQTVGAPGTCGDALTNELKSAHYVVGNPPWQSYSGRQSYREKVELAELIERHPEVRGWPSSHGLFTLEALRVWLASDEGATLGFVLPASFAHLDAYRKLRAAVREVCHVEEPMQILDEDAFAGVIHESLILIARRRESPAAARDTSPFQVKQREAPSASGDDGVIAGSRRRDQVASEDEARVEQMRRRPKPAPEMFGDIGVHTGNCARKLILNEYTPGSVPVLEGKDISAFACGPPRRWLALSYEPAEDEYFRVGSAEKFSAAQVIIRQTASAIVACGNPSKLFFRNSVLGCFPPEGVDVGWVLAWLNHELITLYHQATVFESGQKTFPQVKIRHLRNLPCPDWNVLRDMPLPARREQQLREIQRHLLRSESRPC